MFQEQIRKLIERQCGLLRDEANRLGRILAEANPHDPHAKRLDTAAARDACACLAHRAGVLGLDQIVRRAAALDAALVDLAGRDLVRSWHLVDLMKLHADLANAVDELEAEDTDLYAGCAAPSASKVAPPPALL